jgi:RNA polymerase sigma factor (sigma-70 family)
LVVVTGSLAEAEELAQEAMARAYERWDRICGMRSARGYVYLTAVNLNRKRLRRLAVQARKLLAAAPPEPDLTETVGLRRDLMEALAALPRGHREVLVLVGWLGMDAEKAGKVLGITASSVRSRLARARSTVREILGGPRGPSASG